MSGPEGIIIILSQNNIMIYYGIPVLIGMINNSPSRTHCCLYQEPPNEPRDDRGNLELEDRIEWEGNRNCGSHIYSGKYDLPVFMQNSGKCDLPVLCKILVIMIYRYDMISEPERYLLIGPCLSGARLSLAWDNTVTSCVALIVTVPCRDACALYR